MQEILLHTCCAPCSAAIIEWMLANNIRPTLYYYNPNIYPSDEYKIRKAECTRYAKSKGVVIIDDDYNHSKWLDFIKGTENEPERGKRCMLCFKFRLLHAAEKTFKLGFERFATTLASSRWKNLDQIAEAGYWAAGQFDNVTFWEKNWRKDGLSERRVILLKENNFYNQQYCGCEFSIKGKESPTYK